LQFSVSDTVVGSFTVEAEQQFVPAVDGASGVITVNTSTPHHFVKLSPETPLTVRTVRTLSVRLEDVFDNVLAGETVTFTRTSAGDGYFGIPGNVDSTDVTDVGGIATVDYTASTLVSDGPDVIEVTIGSVSATYTLPLQSDALDTLVFTPSGPQTISAGSSVGYVLTGQDQYFNNVVSTATILLTFNGSGRVRRPLRVAPPSVSITVTPCSSV
jgi:hypothetical protein